MRAPDLTRWVSAFKLDPAARRRLICFPYAGATAGVYGGWGGAFPDHELYGVTLPGRGLRFKEPFETDIVATAKKLAAALTPLADKPWVFYGHSLGGRLAYLTARELRRLGRPLPVGIVVSAVPAPEVVDHAPWHVMNDENLVAELRITGGTSEAVFANAELLALSLAFIRADAALAETYVYTEEAPLPVPLHAIFARGDKLASPEEVALWEGHTSAAFALHEVSGDHMFVNRPDFVTRLASIVRAL